MLYIAQYCIHIFKHNKYMCWILVDEYNLLMLNKYAYMQVLTIKFQCTH